MLRQAAREDQRKRAAAGFKAKRLKEWVYFSIRKAGVARRAAFFNKRDGDLSNSKTIDKNLNRRNSMKEIKSILKAVTDGLKAMAKGIDAVAAKVGEMSKQPAKVKKAAKGPSRKAKPKAKATKKAPAKKAAPKITSETTSKDETVKTAVNAVFDIIKESEQGIDTAALTEKTGFDRKKIANIVFKLRKQGKITSVSKGAYKLS
jgi:hypothetical protein